MASPEMEARTPPATSIPKGSKNALPRRMPEGPSMARKWHSRTGEREPLDRTTEANVLYTPKMGARVVRSAKVTSPVTVPTQEKAGGGPDPLGTRM